MSGPMGLTDTALQICFGILGFIGVLAAIAGISYETSLGAFVYRRWLESRPRGKDKNTSVLEPVS